MKKFDKNIGRSKKRDRLVREHRKSEKHKNRNW